MSIKVTRDDYPEIIEIYNTKGKKAAHEMICDKFKIKNPTCVMKRIKNEASFQYDSKNDTFNRSGSQEENKLFLNLDELCNKATSPRENAQQIHAERSITMEQLVQSLISDRLLELSRYIIMAPADKHVIIDRNALLADGYKVSIN